MGQNAINPFPSALSLLNFASANVPYTPGSTSYQEIGKVTSGAAQAYQVGVGQHTGRESALGRLKCNLFDTSTTPVQITGMLRLDVEDGNGRVVGTVWQHRTEDLQTSATDPRQWYPLPLSGALVGPNYSLVLKLMADAGAGNGTLNYSSAGAFLMDVTEFTVTQS